MSQLRNQYGDNFCTHSGAFSLSKNEVIKIIRTLNLNRETTAILENAYAISYEKQVNAIWQASFSLPINDPKVDKVESLKYVEITDEYKINNDNGELEEVTDYIGLFRIIPKLTVKNTTTREVRFQCEHVLATLLDKSLFKYHQRSNFTTSDNIEHLLNQQNHKHWRKGDVEFTRYFHYAWENENLLSAIFSVPNPFDEPYIWEHDTQSYPWTLSLVKPETEPICRIKEGYNLVGLEVEENPMNSYNRIYPLGAGEGVNQLTIESVNNGVPYLEDLKPGEEIREYVWPDKRFTDAESLKASAEALLKKWKEPIVSWRVTAADISSITGLSVDKFEVGKVVRLELDDFPTTDLRIMKVSKPDMTGDPGNVQMEIGNVVEDLSTTQADMERRQQINELYSQGATNILNFTYQDNADSDIPAVIPFYIDDDVVNINTVELTFRTKRFRAYSRATDGGGATVKSTSAGGGTSKSTSSGGGTSRSTATGGASSQTSSPFNRNDQISVESGLAINLGNGEHHHKVPIPLNMFYHTHSIEIPAHHHDFEIPNHTHDFEIPSHTHNIDLPNHTHNVAHEIVELGSTPNSVTIKVDGNTVPHTSTRGDRINLVDYMSKDNSGKVTRGRHEVEILPNGLARIEGDLILRVFIQSQLGGNF